MAAALLAFKSPAPLSSPVVLLGKRKQSEETRARDIPTYILNVNPKSPILHHQDELPTSLKALELDESCPSRPSTRKSSRSRSASASSSRKKSYICGWDGCDKAYTKPCRLAEHFRSHTGDRPFKCSSCDKSFLRKVHLQAHLRSHASKDERPLVCTASERCGQRFWTQQQLKVHEDMHRGERPYQCIEEGCEEGFTKHSQLRSHIATAHSPPGTKPFQCNHGSCPKSFSTSQKLKAHIRTHDDNRYACYEPACASASGNLPAYFRTWTDLQSHLRDCHPPMCLNDDCNGRTFRDARSLKQHMQMHEPNGLVYEEDPDDCVVCEESDEDSVAPSAKRQRIEGKVLPFCCEELGCSRAFKTVHLLRVHHHVKHLGQLDFACTNAGCDKRFGYKRNLQHHLRTCRPELVVPSIPSATTRLTGQAYVERASAKRKVLPCPWTGDGIIAKCDHVYGRMYDLRRHLKSVHGLEVDMASLEAAASEVDPVRP